MTGVCTSGVSLATLISVLMMFLIFILGGMFKMTRWFISRFANKLDALRKEFAEDFSTFKNEIRKDLDEVKSELRCLKKEFNSLARSLPEKYVLQEAFSQDLSEIKNSISSMRKDFYKLSEKLAKTTQRVDDLERVSPE